MSETRSDVQQRPVWLDYLELCKPRVVALMLLCVTVGMVLASPTGLVPLELLLITNLGVALVAGSAACVNHIVDAQADAIMARTAQRPIAEGRIAIGHGIIFSGVPGTAASTLSESELTVNDDLNIRAQAKVLYCLLHLLLCLIWIFEGRKALLFYVRFNGNAC